MQEDKLLGMTATMQQWRTLTGQMTEERNTVLEEVARLRTILEKLLAAHSRGCRCLVCDVARDVLRGE